MACTTAFVTLDKRVVAGDKDHHVLGALDGEAQHAKGVLVADTDSQHPSAVDVMKGDVEGLVHRVSSSFF